TWFGKFPSYFDYFLRSCSYNRDIDFIIFTDNADVPVGPGLENIFFKSLTLDLFNKLATEKLACEVALVNGYKLCDIKPFYGKIYEDFIAGYEFWGFCDVDIILGNLSAVLTLSYLQRFDVISSHSQYLAGPFSLLRNTPEVNLLFSKSQDWQKVVQSKKSFAFDEASSAMPHLWGGGNIFEVGSEVESMTHLLLNPKKCALRVSFGGFIVERLTTSYLLWQEGALRTADDAEVAVFHHIIYKGALAFSAAKLPESAKKFTFDAQGFFVDSTRGRAFLRADSFVKNFYAKSSNKLKKLLRQS
nr:hypothetical protein [Tanacetum cinerariifolium]